MRNKKLYVCSKCNHIELEHKSLARKLLIIPKAIFFILLGVTSIIGILGLYNVVAYGIYEDPNLIFQPAGSFWGIFHTFKSDMIPITEKKIYQEYAMNLTINCSQDKECQARKIFEHLESFTYEEGADMNPIDILQKKSGDCDEVSLAYVYLLKSLNIKSGMQCSYNHCWVIIFLEDKKIIADAVNSIWRVK